MEMERHARLERFEDLDVWRRAHALVLEVYRLTGGFPNDEKFGLVSQMRRAAVSVPANIAEGFKKRGNKDKANFYNIAQGAHFKIVVSYQGDLFSGFVIVYG